jgi:hypothetical protein
MYKQYKNLDGTTYQNGVIRTSDNAVIPFDPDNTDYQAYLAWVEAGGVPLPAEETQ